MTEETKETDQEELVRVLSEQTKYLNKINDKLSFFTFIIIMYIILSILNWFLSI